ncbi:hypothetical protein [Aliiroseovarius subalbicans]|uniref:hypothetical protein n=1 Tax=Aliiroseovarius subalbicans TaxID=2925840 RepID=UPI001F577098|nr:hypothetical protein [Aliiroseovarius subalbicans]MCI2401187.1 hypothetical protein [Aliiroseovarius subalbicans]
MTIHAFTSFTYSYLNRARVLAATLRQLHPDWTIWAVVTDKTPEGFDFNLAKEDFHHVITAEDLVGDGVDQWLFGHDVVEACTAVKGLACAHLLRDVGAEKVIYLDPDIAVFGDLSPVADLLDTHSIVLTPHQTIPETDPRAIIDNEVASLHYGTYNLGFLALRNDSEALKFVDWWADRLHDWCHDRLDIGVFVDQKWCNLIPCFFDHIATLRDDGFNVASWNLSQRELSFSDQGEGLINGVPLRFFHFTKLGPVGDQMTRRYAGDNTEVFELWRWYRRAVEGASDRAIPEGWWYYGRYDDGAPIPKEDRALYRTRPDLRRTFPDPRRTGVGSFRDWRLAQEGERV